jgi:CRISPR-associated protein Cmr5
MSQAQVMPKLLVQQRARYALEKIEAVKKEPYAAAYGRLVRRLPAMVLHNGLGQALAFLLSDDKGGINGRLEAGRWRLPKETASASGWLYWHLEEWLCGEPDENHPRRVYSKTPTNEKGVWQNQLITQLMDSDRNCYLQAQQEALALLQWMRRFADAFLPKEGES